MLNALEIRNIRVYEQAKIYPDPSLNLIWGANASGKTSLLEAIYLLGTGRSYRSKQLEHLLRHGTDEFGVYAKLAPSSNQDSVHVGFSFGVEGRRISLNGLPQSQISSIAQLFPLQVISPDSHYEFRSSSRQRRAALDWGLFHVEPEFPSLWNRYQRQLQQRNAALKSERQSAARQAWDEGLALMGEQVQAKRVWLLEQLKPAFLVCCHELLGSDQKADLILESGWEANRGLAERLKQDLLRDTARGFTHSGPHRADLRIVLRDSPQQQEIEPSHGQYKILVLALRLALIRRFVEIKKQSCCLLIDDLAAEIDTSHRARLTAFLARMPIQLFVTSTDHGLIDLSSWRSYKSFHVEQGHIKELISDRNSRAQLR